MTAPNIAIIGSRGRMGGFHREVASGLGFGIIEVDTIIDQPDEEVEEYLENADYAIIATPTNTHHAWAHNLIMRGIPTLIEKPLATSPTEAASIKTAADFNHVPVAVGYLNRFNPAWLAMDKAMIGGGRFWANRSGRLVGREYGGAGLDLGTHDIDLILNRWPDAEFKQTVRTVQVAQWEVSVPSANVVGRVTARYAARTKAPNIREWTWVGNDSGFYYADLTEQLVVAGRGPREQLPQVNQVEEQLYAFIDYSKGNKSNVATVEDGIAAMAVSNGR